MRLPFFLCTIALSLSLAAEFDVEQERTVANNPPGLSLSLRFADGKSVFRQGEPIRVEVLAQGPAEEISQYELHLNDPQKWFDQFITDRPNDVIDPFKDFLLVQSDASRFAGPLGEPLGGHPQIVYLNGWCRFAKPGKYRLYFKTDRVTQKAAQYIYNRKKFVTASEILECEILPRDATLDHQEFEKALSIVQQREDRVITHQTHAEYVEWERARMTIRFLETPEAIGYLVHRLYRQEFETAVDLYGQPQGKSILKQLEKELYQTDHPIGFGFIDTLTNFSLMCDGIATSNASNDPRYQKRWSEMIMKVLDAVWVKDEAARGASIITLLSWNKNWQQIRKPAPDSRYIKQLPKLTDEVLRLFDRLPDQEQTQLMVAGLVGDDKRLPFLRGLYSEARRVAEKDSLPKGQRYQTRIATAVNELYRALPAEGAAIIAAEENNPRPVFNRTTLNNLRRWTQKRAATPGQMSPPAHEQL